MRTFEKNSAIKLLFKFTDFDGTVKDCDSTTAGLARVSIYDSDGNVEVSSQAMTKQDTGEYYYLWTPTVEDIYLAHATGQLGGYTAYLRKKFKVIETRTS